MIGLNDIGLGQARAKRACFGVKIADLDHKWSATSNEACSACNGPITGEDENGDQIVALRLWKGTGKNMLELALCPKCWEARIQKSP